MRWLLLLLCPLLAFAADPLPAQKAPLAEQALLLAVAKAGSRLVAVGEHGIVMLSDDDGVSWRQASEVPTRTTLTALSFVGEKQGWAVGHGAQVLATQDGGEHWQVLAGTIDGENSLFSVLFEDDRRGLAVGPYGYAIATTDGGKTWDTLAVGEGDDAERHLNHVMADAGGRLYVMAESGGVFLSDDAGRTWRLVQTPYEGSLWGGLVRQDGSVLALGMAGHALLSRDRGESWTELATGVDQSLTGAAELPDGRLVMVGLGGAMSAESAESQFAGRIRDDRQPATAVVATSKGLVLFTQGGIQHQPLP